MEIVVMIIIGIICWIWGDISGRGIWKELAENRLKEIQELQRYTKVKQTGMTIYKYPIKITDRQSIMVPMKHTMLSVGEQGGKLVIWAMVDSNDAKTEVAISVYGTGTPSEPMEYEEYIGTVQTSNGLVWHVFKER